MATAYSGRQGGGVLPVNIMQIDPGFNCTKTSSPSVRRILSTVFVCLLTLLCFSPSLLAQVETVPAEHPVYPFLKKMQVEGFLTDYSDVVLPLSKEKIRNCLSALDTLTDQMNSSDKEFFYRMKEKLLPEKFNNLFDNTESVFISGNKNLYTYNDSLITFFINPLVKYSYINSEGSSSLVNLGGKAYGSYDGWFGFYIQGTNGMQYGSRETARIDPDVARSFTFNHTGLDYYDGTKGYLRLQKGIVSFQLGRERILWGTGYLNRLLLTENPPMFDFIKFDIGYKSFTYNFIHGWLVQKPLIIPVDSLSGNIKQKVPKYFAISRLSFTPWAALSFGISQVIVYSNRAFEAAYLNPFLFWESAQRSMNDVDNSMLTIDARWLVINGIEFSGAILVDDLSFGRLSEDRWIDNTNGSAWQAGTYIASPVLPDNMSFRFEYTQIRPYMFSHPGGGESLTYTNNGYILGTGVQPNSVLISAMLDYRISGRLYSSISYGQYLHGNNIYDEFGNLVRNVGGNVFNNLSMYDSQKAFLLDGIRERTDEISLRINYEAFYGLFFDFMYTYRKIPGDDKNIFRADVRIDFE